jgi:hypothetical protein
VGKIKLEVEGEEEKSKWPLVVLGCFVAISIAAIVATFAAFPTEMVSMLHEAVELLSPKEKESAHVAQENRSGACTGFVNFCKIEQHVTQSQPADKPPTIVQQEAPAPSRNPTPRAEAEAKPEPVPLPRPHPDMWRHNYLAWVARRSSAVGDSEGPRFTKEWRSCDLPKPHPICRAPLWFRMNPDNYPVEIDALKSK